jgi:hypothetical protein
MTNEDKQNLIEALKTKILAHEKFIIMNMHRKERREQAFETFGAIYSNICYGELSVPDKFDTTYCAIFDEETHYKVIDTYQDIYTGLYERYNGRSGDAYMEKL